MFRILNYKSDLVFDEKTIIRIVKLVKLELIGQKNHECVVLELVVESGEKDIYFKKPILIVEEFLEQILDLQFEIISPEPFTVLYENMQQKTDKYEDY